MSSFEWPDKLNHDCLRALNTTALTSSGKDLLWFSYHNQSYCGIQQIDNIFSACVRTVIDHRWRHSVQIRKKYETGRSRVVWLLFFTRCDVICDLLQYTHTEKCYLFVLYNKNSNVLLKDFGGMKKEKQVCWRDLTWIWRHLCMCPLIDHGQQPMKMPTEVTLLCNCS